MHSRSLEIEQTFTTKDYFSNKMTKKIYFASNNSVVFLMLKMVVNTSNNVSIAPVCQLYLCSGLLTKSVRFDRHLLVRKVEIYDCV